MNDNDNNLDQPTIIRKISPRVRTALNNQDNNNHDIIKKQNKISTNFIKNNISNQNNVYTKNILINKKIFLINHFIPISELVFTRAAASLLLIISYLRSAIDKAEIDILRQQVINNIEQFELLLENMNIEQNDIISARYLICSTIDETVLGTLWGSQSTWSSNSLLNQLHNETWGGEKFFDMLSNINKNPISKLPLLMLIHFCLMLGFEGKYRVLEEGKSKLINLHISVFNTINRHSKIKLNNNLSKIKFHYPYGNEIFLYPPIWIILLICCIILIIIRGYSELTLRTELLPIINIIQSLKA